MSGWLEERLKRLDTHLDYKYLKSFERGDNSEKNPQ